MYEVVVGMQGEHPIMLSKWILMCLVAVVLTGCQSVNANGEPIPDDGDVVWLTLHGYNYTDHYIDNYYVDGAWGGNLFVSTPTAGGSKSTCCVKWKVDQDLPVTVHVRWASGECVYTQIVDDEPFLSARVFYSEKDVAVHGPIPPDPKFFETHIYPDGHVEVAITDDYSPPRLKLPMTDHKRPGAKPWPVCEANQIPESVRRRMGDQNIKLMR